jgi:hypothetical protein
MREANYRLPLEEPVSSPVLYGVARGLEDMFPVVEHSSLSDWAEDGVVTAEMDVDETGESER